MIALIACQPEALIDGQIVIGQGACSHATEIVSLAPSRAFHLAPQALRRPLQSLDALDASESLLGSELPSKALRAATRRYLEGLNSDVLFATAASRLEPFQGELHVHWFGINGTVSLMFTPGAPDAPKLYRETHDGRLASHSELRDDPTEADVREAIEWVAR